MPTAGDHASSSASSSSSSPAAPPAARPQADSGGAGHGKEHQLHQDQKPTSSVTTLNGRQGGPEKLNHILDANYLGVHELAVRQVQLTEYFRQLNARGLRRVRESIAAKGWVASNTPYVLIPREQLPDGKHTVFSPDLLKTLTAYTLDGNHRVQALRELKGPSFVVECRLYLHFDCARTINALARSVNTVTEVIAEMTTYDRIVLTMKAMEAIMTEKGLRDPARVTTGMLAEAYRLGGDVPPSHPQLCGNKRLAVGFSKEALSALKDVSQSENPWIDVPSLSKNLLDSPIVTTELKQHPLEQSLLVHILARFKKYNKRAPIKDNLKDLKERVMQAGELHRQVESVIPRGSWTPEFEKSFYDLVYGREVAWDTWGCGHMDSMKEKVADLEKLLPIGVRLSAEHIKTIKCKLPCRLEQIARESSDLRPYLKAWEQRMAGVNTFIKLRDESSDSSSSSSSSDEEGGGEGEDRRGRTLCTHWKSTRAMGNTDQQNDEEGGAKERPCVKFPTDQPPAKKQKKTVATLVRDENTTKERPSVKFPTDQPPAKKSEKAVATLVRDENAGVETRMSRNTAVCLGHLFAGRTRAYNGGTPLKVNRAPKLAILDLTRETHLFETTDSSRRNLKVILESVVEALHPQGTIAFAMPRPWPDFFGTALGAFANVKDKVIIEDNPLIVFYDEAFDEPIIKGHENYIRSSCELILVAHRICTPDKPFTCNMRVVPSDVYGRSTGPFPVALSSLEMTSLAEGGSRNFFPSKVAHLLIGRFTNATDTVLGIGVETTTIAEKAIEKGRRVEFYLTDDDKRGVLSTKIHDAFRTGQSRDLVQSWREEQARVELKVSPSELLPSTMPQRVTSGLQLVRSETDGDDECPQFFRVKTEPH